MAVKYMLVKSVSDVNGVHGGNISGFPVDEQGKLIYTKETAITLTKSAREVLAQSVDRVPLAPEQ